MPCCEFMKTISCYEADIADLIRYASVGSRKQDFLQDNLHQQQVGDQSRDPYQTALAITVQSLMKVRMNQASLDCEEIFNISYLLEELRSQEEFPWNGRMAWDSCHQPQLSFSRMKPSWQNVATPISKIARSFGWLSEIILNRRIIIIYYYLLVRILQETFKQNFQIKLSITLTFLIIRRYLDIFNQNDSFSSC